MKKTRPITASKRPGTDPNRQAGKFSPFCLENVEKTPCALLIAQGVFGFLQINPPVKGGALFFFRYGLFRRRPAVGHGKGIAAGHELPDLADRTLWDPIR